MDVQPTVKINSQPLKRVKCTKELGVQIDEHLSWNQHIEAFYESHKEVKSNFIDTSTLALVYNALIQPHFVYCCEV